MTGNRLSAIERYDMVTATRVRLASAAFLIAGVLFTAYPALRPFSDEVGLSGAAAFGSQAWIVAHVLAIFAFVLVVLGLLGVWLRLASTRAERAAFVGLVLSWMGAGLLLPFYGAEVFGLHAIGQAALARSDPSLVTLADAVRGE